MKPKTKMYIDVDGVLLVKIGRKVQLAYKAEEFIRFAVSHYDCYWLTILCRGDTETVLRNLRQYVDDETFRDLCRIKPTDYQLLKTEAIDPDEEFIWVENELFQAEIQWLEDHDKMASWYLVKPSMDFDALHELLVELRAYSKDAGAQ
ncbi:hypothetical protein P4B35_18370 [Pontiellaceae bacterium B12227]|nr:hypothetical protein [Pontiellaceae bacterium B12227]